MSDGSASLPKIAALLDAFPTPRSRELHCHPAVIERLRALIPEADPKPKASWDFSYGAIGSLTGIPVIEDADLAPGWWELRENGKMIDFGQIRPAAPEEGE
jgi:hypothetical protein